MTEKKGERTTGVCQNTGGWKLSSAFCNSIVLHIGLDIIYLAFCCYLHHQFFNHHRYRADGILIPVLRQALSVTSHFMTAHKIILFSLLTLAACSTQNDKSKMESQQVSVDILSKDKSLQSSIANFDTLTLDKKAAVFYSPDKTQIAKRKKEIGEENFYVSADDYLYSMYTSHEFLDSIKLTILDAKDKKYLKFIFSDKSQTTIKLDTLAELWGVYFFDPNKRQKQVDMTIIDEEYKSYFK